MKAKTRVCNEILEVAAEYHRQGPDVFEALHEETIWQLILRWEAILKIDEALRVPGVPSASLVDPLLKLPNERPT